MNHIPPESGEIVLYSAEGGEQSIQVRLEGESVWLTQRLLADLYQIGVNTINHHIKTIYADNELTPEATIRKYRIVQMEGKRALPSSQQ